MVRITEDLVRKRAEHNEGILADLEEVSLHQFEIERIENLDKMCRHLRILYLQNNIIGKLENLSRLKELDYLNVALNNISMIEGLEGCESLRKLDLTVNFIDLEHLEQSVRNLKVVESLRELFLTGNPCESWEGCRAFVVAHLPQLATLNSKEITPSERITALQNLPQLSLELRQLAEANLLKKQTEPPGADAYTKESRLKMYRELAEEKAAKEKAQKGEPEAAKREPLSVYNHNGEIRQCNEGKYEFHIDEDEQNNIVVSLHCPKFLDTSMIDVDVQPLFVRMVVKGKVTQLRLPEECSADRSRAERSQITGVLKLTIPKVNQSKRRIALQRSVIPPSVSTVSPQTDLAAVHTHTGTHAATAPRPFLEIPDNEEVDESDVPPLC